jgi:hypothetical protein
MKNQVFNPYLPSWEYVPDGEALSVSVPMNSSAAFSVAPRHAGIVLHLPRRGRRGLYRVFYHVILANEKKLRAA